LNAPKRRRRRDRDPYAESLRERHTVGINAINFNDVRGQKAAVEAMEEVVRLFQDFKSSG
jgi:hypothetical protein